MVKNIQRDMTTIKFRNNAANLGNSEIFTFSRWNPRFPQVNRNIVLNQFLACFNCQILLIEV